MQRDSGATICRLKSLPAHSPSWEFLTGTSQRARPFFVKTAGPKRLFYSIEMGESWTSYLARFTGKQRNDLKRKQRLLSEAAKGELQVKRIASEDLIREMYGDLKRCFDDAWQRTGKKLPSLAHLEDAARRKFLRAYPLYAGDTAIAYAIGYQSHGVFHYSDVGFSMKYVKWSPGPSFCSSSTRDLADHEPVHWVNFGIGSAEYKRRFSNVTTEDSTVYAMRRTVRNRLRAVALDLVAWAWQVKAKRKAAAARRSKRRRLRLHPPLRRRPTPRRRSGCSTPSERRRQPGILQPPRRTPIADVTRRRLAEIPQDKCDRSQYMLSTRCQRRGGEGECVRCCVPGSGP